MDIGRDARRIGVFDIDTLVAGIRALTPEQWLADDHRQKVFDAHSSTRAIMLIGDADFRHQDPTVHDAYRVFAPQLTPLIRHVHAYYAQTLRQRTLIDQYGTGYFVRAILTRLPAGAQIGPHIDEGHSLKRSHRIHIPVITNRDAMFRVGDPTLHMQVGEMWEINNRRIHAVRNDGSEARVHLIMDYVQPGETVFDADGPLTA